MTADDPLASLVLDDRIKGMAPGQPPLPMRLVGSQGWRVLEGDLPLPLAVLKEEVLAHNGAWMRRFLALTGARLAPHGKTTMSPQLFHRQIADGAWGITLATAHQVAVAHRYGIRRVVLANQLVGRAAIDGVLQLLARDSGFDFHCLVDSPGNVAELAAAARAHGLRRPVKVLLEGGFVGGRTGVRDVAAGLAVARAVQAEGTALSLVGVEGFEGLFGGASPEEAERKVGEFLDFLVALARAVDEAGLFGEGELLLSAGGSAFYDLVADRFARAGLSRPVAVVIRSGCYLTHDSIQYRGAFGRLLERSEGARGLGEGLQAALELWAYVQSRPEPTRAIVGVGKRDATKDELPVPLLWHRPGRAGGPQPVGPGHHIVGLNDQHGHLVLPADSPLAVGDMVAFGISHPCLTFDKWQFMPVVDAGYRVIDGIRTFF
ncbi:MAG: amino acid deaminase [Dongiaceae bacterium]